MKFFYQTFFSAFIFLFAFTLPAYPQDPLPASDPGLAKFREAFYLPHELRLKYPTYDCLDFILTQQEEKDWNSFFSVITGFDKSILQTRILKDIQTVDEAREYFEKYRKEIKFGGVVISEVTLVNREGKLYKLYWVGQRAFSKLNEAKNAIKSVKKAIEAQGLDFGTSVQAAKKYAEGFTGAEKEAAVEEPCVVIKPDWLEQEEGFFTAYDGLNLRSIWGKYPDEDWFLYQSIGEATYRQTNLDDRGFNTFPVGFFFNRLLFRGLKFAGSSIDPYIEHDLRFEANDLNFNNTIDFAAGLEYRPFRKNKWLESSPWTAWIMNFRTFVEYIRREPVKDIILFSRDHEVKAGVDYFKEWGIDMPKEGDQDTWLWGELFIDWHFEKTNFSVDDDFDAFIFNDAAKIGIKWPRIPLPKNSINDELVIMPYILYDRVANSGHSSFFQNRFFLGGGVRLMPFRSYRLMNSQWLFRTKIFFEYEGIGAAQYTKADPPSRVPDRDYRVGVNFSLNRF